MATQVTLQIAASHGIKFRPRFENSGDNPSDGGTRERLFTSFWMTLKKIGAPVAIVPTDDSIVLEAIDQITLAAVKAKAKSATCEDDRLRLLDLIQPVSRTS